MKKICLFILATLLAACSSIDSLKPFDQEQAAKLLENQKSSSLSQSSK